MYYQEKLIDNVWHYKLSPRDAWSRMSSHQLTSKIEALNKVIKKLK